MNPEWQKQIEFYSSIKSSYDAALDAAWYETLRKDLLKSSHDVINEYSRLSKLEKELKFQALQPVEKTLRDRIHSLFRSPEPTIDERLAQASKERNEAAAMYGKMHALLADLETQHKRYE